MRTIIAILFLTLIGSEAPSTSAQDPQPVVHGQSEFGTNSGLDRAVPIPKKALDLVRSTLNRSPDQLPDRFVEASQIHLDGPGELDLIVLCYVSSHGARFLILKPSSVGYSPILDSGGDYLKVLRTRSNSYRDIYVEGYTQGGKFTTKAIYRFNGQQYVKASEKTERTK